MEKVDLNSLSDNGKKEVKQITIKKDGKEYSAIFVVDFVLYNKAYRKIMGLRVENQGKKSNANIDPDILGAGDKILFDGFHSGDEEIRRNMRLRTKFAHELGQWMLELIGGDEDDEESKKK